jgi:cold shock CspA family protein
MTTTLISSPDNLYIGVVKWYNMDLRYGFITVLDKNCPNNNIDIFAHKKDITTKIRYKCLIEGEYVNFNISNTEKGLKCINITGIDNNNLLCESNPDLLKKLILCQYIEKTNPNLSFIKMS